MLTFCVLVESRDDADSERIVRDWNSKRSILFLRKGLLRLEIPVPGPSSGVRIRRVSSKESTGTFDRRDRQKPFRGLSRDEGLSMSARIQN
jgi:hypothetical protein